MFAQFAQNTLNYTYPPSTTTTTTSAGTSAVVWIVWLFAIIVMWRFFTKAGRPGWASIIPLYNVYTLVKVAGRPGWWVVLLFIPLVNIVVSIILGADTGERFGHSRAYGAILMGLLGIGYIITAFNGDTYRPLGSEAPAATTPSTPVASQQ